LGTCRGSNRDEGGLKHWRGEEFRATRIILPRRFKIHFLVIKIIIVRIILHKDMIDTRGLDRHDSEAESRMGQRLHGD
jgi:hypothetical protein